jgi:predicted helicase
MKRMIEFYNQQSDQYHELIKRNKGRKPLNVDDFIDNDPTKISWSGNLKSDLEKHTIHSFNSEAITNGMYRPFSKQKLYFDRRFNERVYQMPKILPNKQTGNLVIAVTGIGASKDFSALITDTVPNLHMHDTGQCFSLYRYEKAEPAGGLFNSASMDGYTRKDNIPDSILKKFRATYDAKNAKIAKEDIFYYVYGILHSPEYKRRFEADLKKMLPRMPMAKDFWVFSKAGRSLAEWHLNYETVEPYPLNEASTSLGLDPKTHYKVQKMTFGKKNKEVDKKTIVYNSNVTLTGIPLEAYDYIVNGKSALEWIMERYQFTRDKDSQITNDPNDWSDDPRYIIDLVKRIVRVSVETMRIVNSLPALNERK